MFRTTTQVEIQQIAITRAELVAAGIIRYHKFKLLSPGEMQQALEILADELAKIEGLNEALMIRKHIENCGLQIPKPSIPVHVDRTIGPDLTVKADDSGRAGMCKPSINIHCVHPISDLDAQEQQKSGVVHDTKVNRTFTNIYFQGANSAPVPQGSVWSGVAHRTREGTQSGDMSARMKNDDATRKDAAKVDRVGEIYGRFDSRGWTGSWTWRNRSYNRVPPAIEASVYEKFKQGWSKSRLAREFRLNRRTIIRICKAGSLVSE